MRHPPCPDANASLTSDFVFEKNFDIVFLRKTWLKPHGHEPKMKQRTPPGYKLRSLPRPSLGWLHCWFVQRHVFLPPFLSVRNFPFHLYLLKLLKLSSTPPCVAKPSSSFHASTVHPPAVGKQVHLFNAGVTTKSNHSLNTTTLVMANSFYYLLADLYFFNNQNSTDTKPLCLFLTSHSLARSSSPNLRTSQATFSIG